MGPMRCLGRLDMQLGGHLVFLFGLTRPNPLAPCISVRDLDAIGAILGLRPWASIISTSTLPSGDTSTSRLATRTLGQSDSLPSFRLGSSGGESIVIFASKVEIVVESLIPVRYSVVLFKGSSIRFAGGRCAKH